MSRFDALAQPLQGTWLVDASAGTGKTHAITSLVLRLLLGHDGSRTGNSPRGIEELLIVTFTNAATNELRGRIRKRVQDAVRRFSGEAIRDPDELIEQLLRDSHDPAADRERLALASVSMDLAAIHTIHAFANRVLQRHAFDSGVPLGAAIHQDAAQDREELALDFWRERVYPLQSLCARLLASELDVKAFCSLVHTLSIRPGLQLRGEVPPDWDTLRDTVQSLGRRLMQAWPSEAAALPAALGALELKVEGKARSRAGLEALARSGEYPEFEVVENLARTTLEGLVPVRSKQRLPASRVLDLADELLALAPRLRNRLVRDALQELGRRNAGRRHASGRLGHDDLLPLLDEGLGSPAGDQLAAAIRERFPVALVDECQDTDPLQWQVFRRIYPEGTLFFVGDPKQSIYAFRGADVYAYLSAARTARGRLTLDVNRRSTPALIAALNGLFALRDDRAPFGAVDIDWREAEAPPLSRAVPLRLDGREQEPLQIIRLLAPESGGKAAAQGLLAAACADQVAGMLRDARAGRLLLGERAVAPADIACLVRTRKEAELLARELAARGVPSVFASRDSVYESPVAADLHRLLLAVLEPRSDRLLRSALGCALACRNAAELEQCLGDERELQTWQQRFVDWRGELGRRGVQAVLRTCLLALGIPERLLARPGGERQLADCLHLVELLGAERELLDSDEALAARFAALIAQPSPERDEQQLRLEGDAQRLRIATIHASKGLEYPIVCLPFVNTEQRARSFLYHDAQSGQAIYDLSHGEAARAAAQQEQLAEDLRLLYVAVTRAKSLLVLGLCEPTKGKGKSPPSLEGSVLGWLLEAQGVPAAQALDRLWSIPGAVAVQPTPCVLAQETARRPVSVPDAFTGYIARDWQESSYSGLARGSRDPAEEFLRKPEEAHGADLPRVASVRDAPRTRHSFPAGSSWGSLLHELMEQADFSRSAGEEPNASLIAALCRRQPLLRDWEPVLGEFLDAVRACPVAAAMDLRLADLPEDARVAEMRFELPVERIHTAGLDALLRAHEPLARETPALRRRSVRGILKGSIDLVACHAGRYYLIDYKSTWLGESASQYTRARIEEDIRRHRYELQYTLYTVALVRLLRARLGPAFDYEQHVGGAIYLYLRALGEGPAADGTPAGVFLRRPEPALIAGIEAMLGGPAG